MNNASAFINAGGSAHWDMLVFEHNEHQIDDAEILAREMGFSWFRYKISKRFKTNPITNLNPPSNFVLPISNNINKIQCHALMERSIYVSATGEKLPCCWIGSRVFNMDTKMRGFLNSKKWSSLIGSWELNPHKICSESCGISHNGETLFNAQWNKEVNLSL
jgi:hypothetical protein